MIGNQRLPMVVIGVFFAVLLIGGGVFALRGGLPHQIFGCGEESELPAPPPGDDLGANGFKNWEKPLFAIVLSGQMHGYINPCGCSHPQNGGLERRYNFIKSLQDKGWNVIGIDLGELAATTGIQEQNMLKYELSVKALRLMNYKAIGIGRDEFRVGMEELLAHAWDEKNKHPRPLLLSLADPNKQLEKDLNLRPFEIVSDTNPKLGIVNMFGPGLCKELEPNPNPKKPKFLDNRDELPRALAAFADAGVDIGIVLQHEYPDVGNLVGIQKMQAIEAARRKQALTCAKFCADARKENAKIPAIHLVMTLIEDPEPPTFMTRLDPKLPTHVVEIGHKGKYVGLVGVYKDKDGYRLQYQKVLMSEDWKTPDKDKMKQPIIALMETYQKKLKSMDMLAQSPRTPHFNQLPAANTKGLTATYVGSDRCKKCHPAAFKAWSDSPHADATATLEKERFPSNRQYDPECMKCHTTGFQHPGGFNDLIVDLAAWPKKPERPTAADAEIHNKKLRNVGCESCHGPASEHVKNTDDPAIRKLLNPYRPTPQERDLEDKLVKNPKDAQSLQAWMKLSANRRRAMEQNNCIKCHDQENDVNWGNEGKDLVTRWLLSPKRLIHHTPNNNGAAAPAQDPQIAPAAGLEPPLQIEVLPEKK